MKFFLVTTRSTRPVGQLTIGGFDREWVSRTVTISASSGITAGQLAIARHRQTFALAPSDSVLVAHMSAVTFQVGDKLPAA